MSLETTPQSHWILGEAQADQIQRPGGIWAEPRAQLKLGGSTAFLPLGSKHFLYPRNRGPSRLVVGGLGLCSLLQLVLGSPGHPGTSLSSSISTNTGSAGPGPWVQRCPSPVPGASVGVGEACAQRCLLGLWYGCSTRLPPSQVGC